MSETTIEKQRVQITVHKQLKTYLQGFLWKRGLGCQVERIRHSADDKDATTIVLFEGETGDIYEAKKDMIESLSRNFPQITIPPDDTDEDTACNDCNKNWIVEPSSEILVAATILKTSTEIRRDNSSGLEENVVPIELAKIHGRESSTSSVISHLLKVPGVSTLSKALQLAGKMKQVVVTVFYMNFSVSVDAAAKDWKAFIDACKDKLKITLPIRKVWHSVDDGWVEISDIEAIVHEHKYRITAGTDPDLTPPSLASCWNTRLAPKFETMDEFYSALQKEGLVDDEDIMEVKEVFQKEKIKAGILPRLNDEKLMKYGLAQGGLREAVLSALGK